MKFNKSILFLFLGINLILFVFIAFTLNKMNKKINKNNKLIIEFYKKPPTQSFNYEITDNDIIIGDTSAPVKFIIFTGYLCPHCKIFFLETFPVIQKEYIETGKVCCIIRYLTSPNNESAFNAAIIAKCIRNEKMFLEYNTLVYQNRDILNHNFIDNILKKLNIDINECNQKDIIEQLITDRKQAFRADIKGTPSFVINKRILKGNRRLKKLREIFDNELDIFYNSCL